MKQKLFTLLLALAASIGTMFASTKIGDLYYNLDATNQTAEVTSQPSGRYSGSVTIPALVEYNSLTYSVTSIGMGAFYVCTGLTSVTIPNSVTSIGVIAFSGCSGLTSVTIPNSVKSIGDQAFEGCTGLTSVTIPNSVTSIGNWAFYGCSGLISVTIPNSVTSIGYCAFIECTGLTSVTIGKSVTSIGDDAFGGCSNIKSVRWNAKNCNGYNFGSQVESFTFGNAVEVIPSSICKGMTKLTTITIPVSVTSIGSEAFDGCSNLTSVTLNSNAIASKIYTSSNNLNSIFGSQVTQYVFGEGVTAIGNYALYNAANLQKITIPSSMTSIGNVVFNNCSKLKTVTINSNTVTSKTYTATNNFATIFGTQVQTYNLGNTISAIGDYAFYNNSLSAVSIPNSVTQIGNSAFGNCVGSSFDIPASVKNIGNKTFAGCAELETMIIRGAMIIGNGAFADCTGLTSIQLGNSLTSIGDTAFSSCYNLAAVEFPSSLQTIGNYAFYQCNKIPSVTIHENITALGEGAFKACSKLTNVSINSKAVVSKEYSASNNLTTIFGNQVQTFYLGEAITSIGDYAFYDNSITGLAIPQNVTQIGSYAFYNCSGLKTIVIPNKVTSIETNMFYDCTALTSVSLPRTITAIKDNAFANCSSLQLDSLPAALTSLGANAFSGCSSLASIALPASITSIGENAFKDCSGISKVKIDDMLAWCKIDFANTQSNPLFYARNLYICDTLLTNLEIPNKVTELKPWAFNNCSNIQSVIIPNTIRNFSPNAFAGCENITSVEWHAKNITDYASSAASPFYASRNKITSFVFGEETEHVPAYICSGMKGINSLAFPSYLKSIGDYAFKGLSKIKQINVPNELTAIGAHAFDSCILVNSIYLGYQVEEIGDYAFKGCIRVNDMTCMNTTTPVVYENTLSSISNYAYLYVPAGSKRTYQLDPYWGRFDIREIASEEAKLAKDSVTVDAKEDNAIFTWPTDSAAASYSLKITKDDEVFCTLVFNDNGQLIGIAFAPSHDEAPHAPAATLSVAGMTFTVTGLNTASKYAYRLAVADENDNEIQTYSGEFATTGYQGEVTPGGQPEVPISTALDQTIVEQTPTVTKFIRDGQLFILRDGKTYTVQGQEVK